MAKDKNKLTGNTKHAIKIINLLHLRPKVLTDDGQYDWVADEQQMIDIVHKYLDVVYPPTTKGEQG